VLGLATFGCGRDKKLDKNNVLAKEQVNGATMAVNEINKQGGLLGRQVALQVRDDESRPDVGIRKFEGNEIERRKCQSENSISTSFYC
jgi:hypothetical protein